MVRNERIVSKYHYRKKLKKMLRSSNLRDILVMVWFVDALRNGKSERVKGHFEFPEKAVSAKPGEQHFVAPWTLETLVNEALVNPPADAHAKRLLNTKRWASFASIFNIVNEIEEAESLDGIIEAEILDAMPRIAWRQFGWQTGYRSAERFFRAWWLYNFSEANDFFLKKYGMSVERFCYVGFAVAALLIQFPSVRLDVNLSSVGVTDAERDAFIGAVSLSSADARRYARMQRAGKGQIAYKPSVLRRAPLITIQLGTVYECFCPIPDLLYLRFSDGLFYDMVGDGNLRRIVGERFEEHAFKVTNHYLGHSYQLLKEAKYGPK